jgi:hypothetical protein
MKKILIFAFLIIGVSFVSAYSTYKLIETDYLNVGEEAVINELMVEENFVMPPDSHMRIDGHLDLPNGWTGACNQYLIVEDGIVVDCQGEQ